MSLNHRKEVQFFTVTLDEHRSNIVSLMSAAQARVINSVGMMKSGQEIAGKALQSYWYHEISKEIFMLTPEHEWLIANKVEWSLVHSHYGDITDGMVHLYIEGNKHAAQFKLIFGGNSMGVKTA